MEEIVAGGTQESYVDPEIFINPLSVEEIFTQAGLQDICTLDEISSRCKPFESKEDIFVEFQRLLAEEVSKDANGKLFVQECIHEMIKEGIHNMIGRSVEFPKGKRGGSRDHSAQEYQTLIAVLHASAPMLEVNCTGHIDTDGDGNLNGILVADPLNIQDSIVLKNYYEHLSEEAQHLIHCVYNRKPGVETPTGKTTEVSVRNYVDEKDWHALTVARVFEELKEFVECLGD
jgi:hypothetical protein